MIFEHGQRIVFAGDSVTDCGRASNHAPYGDGYVSRLRDLVLAQHPGLSLSWINAGVSGNTVRDLDRRWESDVLQARPDWLSVMIGINDVWRAFQNQPEHAVAVGEYAATLDRLLRAAAGCRLIVAGPYLIEPDRSDPQRIASVGHAAAAREVADNHGARYVDLQGEFDRVLRGTEPEVWAHDRIHPTGAGHTVIALEFLKAIR